MSQSIHEISEKDAPFLEDATIVAALLKMDRAVDIWQSGRMTNNYDKMCYALGLMKALSETVYGRNDQILNEIGTARLAKYEAPSTPPTAPAAPESPYVEERQIHNAPEQHANPNGRTHPAILATTDSASDQEPDEADSDYQVPF